MKNSILFKLLSGLIVFTSCHNHGQLQILTDLPSSLKESSGLAYYKGEDHFWTIEDSGNQDEIYAVDFEGNILKQFEIKNAKNEDWESLATDTSGNLYIGDFGDNAKKRDDLVIFKLPNPENEKGDKIDAEKIRFRYPKNNGKKMWHNAEAFFHFNNALYLFTKTGSEDNEPQSVIYRIPDTKGNHVAERLGTFMTCSDVSICAITGADVSTDGKSVILLSRGFLWIIPDIEWNDFSRNKVIKLDLGVRTQLEAVCFMNDSTLILTDERSHMQGGNVYTLDLLQIKN